MSACGKSDTSIIIHLQSILFVLERATKLCIYYLTCSTAIVENFDNFHVQKWMRQAKNGGPMNHEEKLRVVNRPMNAKVSARTRVLCTLYSLFCVVSILKCCRILTIST